MGHTRPSAAQAATARVNATTEGLALPADEGGERGAGWRANRHGLPGKWSRDGECDERGWCREWERVEVAGVLREMAGWEAIDGAVNEFVCGSGWVLLGLVWVEMGGALQVWRRGSEHSLGFQGGVGKNGWG